MLREQQAKKENSGQILMTRKAKVEDKWRIWGKKKKKVIFPDEGLVRKEILAVFKRM